MLIRKQFICYFLLQEVVLSSEQDPFFKVNMYENFGDIGMNIKRMVDEFQQVSKSNQNIQTIGLYFFSSSQIRVNFSSKIIWVKTYLYTWWRSIKFTDFMIWLLAEDMAKFVDNYPEYRKMHGNVTKHVTLVTEMSKIVDERKLMSVSQTEQELACNGGQGAAFEV